MLPSKKTAICPKCGSRVKAGKSDIMIKEKIVHSPKETKLATRAKEIEGTFPIADAECPKCGNEQAYWWVQQVRGEDEPDTQFNRCTKCRYTWRKTV